MIPVAVLRSPVSSLKDRPASEENKISFSALRILPGKKGDLHLPLCSGKKYFKLKKQTQTNKVDNIFNRSRQGIGYNNVKIVVVFTIYIVHRIFDKTVQYFAPNMWIQQRTE